MKKILPVILILLLGLSLCGCGGEQSGDTDMTLTLGLMPDVESAPFVVAELEGYYAAEGVTVKLIHFKSAKDRDSALQGGQLDGVVNDMVAVLLNNEGGIPMQVVARSNGRLALLGGQDAGITALTAEQLAGRELGLSLNTVMEYTADQMLLKAGQSVEAVQKVAVPQIPTRMEMLQGGRLDLAIMPDPFVSMALDSGATLLVDYPELDHPAGSISFHRDVLDTKGEAVKAVMRAYRSATDAMNEQGIEPWRDDIIEIIGFPEASRELLALPVYDPSLPGEETFATIQGWMLDKGLIATEYDYSAIMVNWE